MNCLQCQARTDVYDTRVLPGQGVRRKRKCLQCGFRFATIETVDAMRKLQERIPKPVLAPRPKKARRPRPITHHPSPPRRAREEDLDSDLSITQDIMEVARELGIEGFR